MNKKRSFTKQPQVKMGRACFVAFLTVDSFQPYSCKVFFYPMLTGPAGYNPQISQIISMRNNED